MLRFQNWEEFHKTVERLDKDYDEHNDFRDLQLPLGLTNEQLDDLDESEGFESSLMYKLLENQFAGYISKRKVIENIEKAWLDNDMNGLDPDDIDLTFDDAENTLFNENYEVKIGCNVYKFTNDGLVNLTNPEETINTESNTNTNQTEAEDCFTNARKRDERIYSHLNQKIRIKVAMNTFILRSSAKAKVVNFRLNGNGKWRRSRTQIAVHIGGVIFDKKCFGNLLIGLRNPTSGFKKRGEIRELYRWYDTNRKTKKHLLAASGELPNLPMFQVLIEK